MRIRTDVLLGLTLLAAVAVGILVSVFGAPPAALQDTRTSTLVPGPGGSQGVYETLARLGVTVRRRRTALFSLAEEKSPIAALAVLAPPRRLMSDELAEVVRYVRGGGTVIVSGEGGGLTACAGFETPRADSGLVTDAMMTGFGRPVAVHPTNGFRLPAVRRVITPWEPAPEFARYARRFRERSGCDSLVVAREDTMLATVDGRAVILRLRFGDNRQRRGTVLLVAEPAYFTNLTWKDSQVPYFLLPLLAPRDRGALVWDEYHQGFEQGSSARAALWGWIRKTPVGWALLQLAAVVLVWLVVKAVRFGPALSVVERRRRSPLEHVDALAAGLEGADGSRTAVELIVAGLRRRLSRTGGGPLATSSTGNWLETLELVVPTERGRAAARELKRLWGETGGADSVLATAQAVEDVWQDLRPKST